MSTWSLLFTFAIDTPSVMEDNSKGEVYYGKSSNVSTKEKTP